MKKIFVPLVNRTNYSKLRSVLRILKDLANIKIILSSGAAVKEVGSIKEDIQNDGLDNIIVVDSCLRNDHHSAMSKNIALSMIQYSTILEQERPDLVLIVGDRFDMLGYAISSAIQNIPTIHIQGGERSGTIDDKVRFSITALADYHFPATEKSKKNVVKCGALPEKVFNYGCPAVGHIHDVGFSSDHDKFDLNELKKYSKRSLEDLKSSSEYILVQVHPNTVDPDDVKMEELLMALNEINLPCIILYPNIDALSGKIIEAMRKYRGVKKFYYYKHFSLKTFVGVMKGCKCFIGNSSSIIRESGLFGVPAINLGTRQSLRETNDNVHDCNFNKKDIIDLFYNISNKKYVNNSVYFNPDSSENIAKKILQIANEVGDK